MKTTYGEYVITYNPKPIPDRTHDYDWVHQDYDGPGDPRAGTAPSIQQAIHAIEELTNGT